MVKKVPHGKKTATSVKCRQVAAIGDVTSFAFDAAGNKISTTDPLGRVTTQVFDAQNRFSAIAQLSDCNTAAICWTLS
jgi:YD repeat-containing protein